MKKILIFYASYGGGHFSAAKSIKQYIDDNYTDTQTYMIDCVKYINKAFEKVTTTAYKEMAKKAPWAWGEVYYKSENGFIAKVSSTSNKIMAVKMAKLFREIKPDVVISTHAFGSQMTSYLKKKGKTNCTLATVMTDFAPHNQWLIGCEFADYIFVSNENMKNTIIENNDIDANKIYVTGIPISNRFLETFNKEQILSEFGLSSNKKTVLFFGGGEYGIGKNKTVNILNILAKSDYNIQVVAIAGRNKKLKTAFENIVLENNKQDCIKVLPFTNKVPELMSISDLVITKPGGLTTSESLASNLPIIIINPIPGQEEQNAKFLESEGAGIWIKKDSNSAAIINSILSDENKLNNMKQNSIKLSKVHSTENICKICLEGKESKNDK